jgi:phenylpyruvate tautomerase PptA (4-oxalocrotonate tautomerase family)
VVANVGKMDAKKHLAANVTSVMSSNINQVRVGVWVLGVR